jgi:hypothetical protein
MQELYNIVMNKFYFIFIFILIIHKARESFTY